MLPILFVGSRPQDAAELDLQGEVETIRAQLAGTPRGRQFQPQPFPETKEDDLQKLLIALDPFIVHWSGHGLKANRRPPAATVRVNCCWLAAPWSVPMAQARANQPISAALPGSLKIAAGAFAAWS